jgi:hypothetical protein
VPSTTGAYVSPRVLWLPADKGKGLEINGTFARRGGQLYMDMTFTNKAMQPMLNFAIQFNKNSFGLTAASPMQVMSPLPPGVSTEVALALATNGPVQKMEPLNTLQVAIVAKCIVDDIIFGLRNIILIYCFNNEISFFSTMKLVFLTMNNYFSYLLYYKICYF